MERSVILEPTTEKQRFIILDALRGLALLGICLANLPEFALWTFLSGEEQAAMPTAEADRVVRFLQYFIVDAKFTAFSASSTMASASAWDWTWACGKWN